jgi:aspartate/methionine/tyrosine aminotransferase
MQVVLFDPMYDSYVPICTVAGAVVRVVRLRDGDWAVPHDELAAAFNSNTKLVVVRCPF